MGEPEEQFASVCRSGYDYMVQLAIRDGIDVHFGNGEALVAACEGCRLSTIKILLETGVFDISTGEPDLVTAVMKFSQLRYDQDRATILTFLLDQGLVLRRSDKVEMFKFQDEEFIRRIIDLTDLSDQTTLDECFANYAIYHPYDLRTFDDYLHLVNKGTLLNCLVKISPVLPTVKKLVTLLDDTRDDGVISTRLSTIPKFIGITDDETEIIEYLLESGFTVNSQQVVEYIRSLKTYQMLDRYLQFTREDNQSIMGRLQRTGGGSGAILLNYLKQLTNE